MAAATYPLERRELVAEAPSLRMHILTLADSQEVPWHRHSEVTEFAPGQMHAVAPRRAHRVTGKDGGPCRFAILQGVGAYDFRPVGG